MRISYRWLLVYSLLASFASTGTMFMSWGLGSLHLFRYGLDSPTLVGVYETVPGVIILETFLMGFGVIASMISLFYVLRKRKIE